MIVFGVGEKRCEVIKKLRRRSRVLASDGVFDGACGWIDLMDQPLSIITSRGGSCDDLVVIIFLPLLIHRVLVDDERCLEG